MIVVAALPCSSSSSTSTGYSPTTDLSGLCTMPLAPHEPVCSTAFADATWSSSHRASYAQGSFPFPGPHDSATTENAHLELPDAGVPVIVSFSAPYGDGGRAAWSTVTGADAAIVKVDHETFEIIDWYVPSDREDDPPTFALGSSGAYTAIDSENRFIVGRTRFVVITDGLGLMNLVLFWRDEVPADWEPIAPGKDPRIACEIPIDFGTGATEAISEQSVAVRGYSAVLVNDLLRNPTLNPPSMLALGALAQNTVSALEGGIPEKAPFGLERIDWDPQSRTCATV